MKLIGFTGPSGDTVWVCPAWVERVRNVVPGESYRNSRTVIQLSGGPQFVTEEIDDVVKKLSDE